ncbi:MAG: PEGA domain-containing protein [Deltaproteobacteria bacterium]|nr:PEGA domain-containing protein [Deltaproteobacteria bacterium]
MSKALFAHPTVRALLRSFLVVAVLLATSMASAQSARTLLRKGNKLFAAGDYRAAFGIFEKGYTKNPSPVFLRSMAFCKLKLYEHSAARKLLKTYLDKFKTTRDRGKLQETVKSLDDVVQTTIAVSSTPPGADIYIDAEATGKVGQTPKTLTIEPGTHTLILRKTGFQVTTKTIDVKARKAHEVSLTLELPFKVTSAPEGADVRVDDAKGTPLGKTPYEGGIAPGKHTVYVGKPGYKTIKREIDAQPGGATNIMAKLSLGVRIDSKPTGAVVMVDGAKVGSTPVEVELTPGMHKLELTLEGFQPVSREVDVKVGKVSDLLVEFEGGLLTMRSSVEGATVEVGGIEIGKTPLEKASVPLGSKEVVLRHPDRRTWSQALDFNDTRIVRARVEMGRKSWPAWIGAGTTVALATAASVFGVISLTKSGDWFENTSHEGFDSWDAVKTAYHADPKTVGDLLEDEGLKDTVLNKNLTNICQSTSSPQGNETTYQECEWGTHTASTALFTAAAVTAVATAAYWYFFVRSTETVATEPRAAQAVGAKRASLPANLPRTAPSLSRSHL